MEGMGSTKLGPTHKNIQGMDLKLAGYSSGRPCKQLYKAVQGSTTFQSPYVQTHAKQPPMCTKGTRDVVLQGFTDRNGGPSATLRLNSVAWYCVNVMMHVRASRCMKHVRYAQARWQGARIMHNKL